VQTNTVQGPGGEAGVMRIKGSGTPRGLAMALAGNSRWCYLNPRWGAALAVAEAARKVACSGATPVAATNCLNFGNPEKPEIMAQLSEAIDGIAQACTELKTPITGGNVSLYNETRGEGIYPTPVIGIVGIIDDVTKAIPAAFQREGDAVMLLTLPTCWAGDEIIRPFGSSEYSRTILGALWGTPPRLDFADELALHECLAALSREGLLRSACDVSDGGLAVALSEASLGRGIGAAIELRPVLAELFLPNACRLFAETTSEAVVSCSPSQVERVREIADDFGFVFVMPLGTVGGDRLEVRIGDELLVNATLQDLNAAWSSTLESLLTEVHA